jgi:hypothetical protein
MDKIIGGSTTDLRGNCISVEGYYENSIRRNAEYNLIQYNTLKNDSTHFAINIFPATNDPAQPPMEGNKIYFNLLIVQTANPELLSSQLRGHWLRKN